MHKFCGECIDSHLSTSSGVPGRDSACPTCKTPIWRRQITPDHTLAAIVAAYRASVVREEVAPSLAAAAESPRGGVCPAAAAVAAAAAAATAAAAAAAAEPGVKQESTLPAGVKSEAAPAAKQEAEGTMEAVGKPKAADEWLETGHAWVGKRVRRFFNTVVSDGTCDRWMPATSSDPALWHVVHDDGDAEDLEEHEMLPAIRAHVEGQTFSHEWRVSGHPWVGERVRRSFHGQQVDGTVERWLPKAAGRRALWHVRHDDGDEEDLGESALSFALVVYEKRFEEDAPMGIDDDDESEESEEEDEEEVDGHAKEEAEDAAAEEEVLAEAEGFELQRSSTSASGYRGVERKGSRFQAIVTNNKKRVNLGTHDTAVEAAVAVAKYRASLKEGREEEEEEEEEEQSLFRG